MARRWSAVWFAAALFAASCSHHVPTELGTQQQAWQQLRVFNYRFDLVSGGSLCQETTTHVTVRNGALVAATVDQAGCSAVPPLSVDGVFDFVAADYRHGYHMTVSYDPTFHFPSTVGVDPSRNVRDDEYGIEIKNFHQM